MSQAKILERQQRRISPWVDLVSKTVDMAEGRAPEVYHCLAVKDYIAILAKTPAGLVPIVRQYRAAVESHTWELPAGALEFGESPEEACRRELKEETGLEAQTVLSLGRYHADTGRMENQLHAFFVLASDPDPHFICEPGLSVEFVESRLLKAHLQSGRITYFHHVGLVALAAALGLLDGPPSASNGCGSKVHSA